MVGQGKEQNGEEIVDGDHEAHQNRGRAEDRRAEGVVDDRKPHEDHVASHRPLGKHPASGWRGAEADQINGTCGQCGHHRDRPHRRQIKSLRKGSQGSASEEQDGSGHIEHQPGQPGTGVRAHQADGAQQVPESHDQEDGQYNVYDFEQLTVLSAEPEAPRPAAELPGLPVCLILQPGVS